MHLLIIGNGFDLVHGLPTRYTDFLRYCRDYKDNEPVSKEDRLNEEFLSFVKDNLWLKYFLSSTLDFDNPRTWIDFEKEIAEIINDLDSAKPIAAPGEYFGRCGYSVQNEIAFEHSQNSVSKKLAQFISAFGIYDKNTGKYVITNNDLTSTKILIDFLYFQLRIFTRAFEIYCLKIGTITTDEILTSGENFDYVLSFNYTNTYKRLYGNNKTRYCYIHGKAQEDSEKTNLILGIDDELTDGYESKDFTWVRFKKYYQRIILKTGSEYKNWLESANNNKPYQNTAYIIGHSLDKTDYDILYEIFTNDLFRIIIYYHCLDDFEDKVQKVIQLLAYKGENGRDELIQRVGGKQWTIKFVDQYDKIEGLFINRGDSVDKNVGTHNDV